MNILCCNRLISLILASVMLSSPGKLAGMSYQAGPDELTPNVTYTYDADGIRTSKTDYTTSGGPTTVKYLTDKNRDYAQVIEERGDPADFNLAVPVWYTYGDDLIGQTRGYDDPAR